MRIKGMWTVGSKYNQKVYFRVFKHTDDSFLKQYDGGWLEPGGAVDVEIDLTKARLGFARDDSIIHNWVRSPVDVETNRSATLSADGTAVVQSEKPQFTDPSRVADVNFFSGLSDDYVARAIVIALAGQIPKAGAVVAQVLSVVWPEKKPDLIKESEERMKKWVKGEIDALKRSNLSKRLSGLRRNLVEYSRATDPQQRERWFDACLAIFNMVQPELLEDEKYVPGTIGLAGDLAAMHLSILRERVVHTREIYGDKQVNVENFKQDLKETIKAYQDFIEKVALPGELEWREKQVEVIYKSPSTAEQQYGSGIDSLLTSYTLKDRVTREVHRFFHVREDRNKEPSVLYYIAQAKNSYELELRKNVVDASKLWSLFDPDQKGTKPIAMDRIVWAGPFSGLPFLQAVREEYVFGDVVQVGPGFDSFDVRSGNWIDALRFSRRFADPTWKGQYVGNATGGGEASFRIVPNFHIQKVETWWKDILYAIKFNFSDGQRTDTTGKLGDAAGSAERHQVASYPNHYLSAVKIGKRMHEIHFGFSPLPNFYG